MLLLNFFVADFNEFSYFQLYTNCRGSLEIDSFSVQRIMYLLVNCLIYICVFVKISEAHYTSQWAVHITGGHKVADQVARDHDFDNQGQVRHFVQKYGISARYR